MIDICGESLLAVGIVIGFITGILFGMYIITKWDKKDASLTNRG